MGKTKSSGQLTDQSAVLAVVPPDVSVYRSSLALDSSTKAIFGYSRSVADGFIGIGLELSKLSKSPSVLTDCGYADVYDYGERVFGFKKTSVKNFIGVYDRFGAKGCGIGAIDDSYKAYGFTQLVELLPVDDVSSYKPEMTVLEIRDKKVLDRVSSERVGLDGYLLGGVRSMLSVYSDVCVGPIKPESWRHVDFAYSFSCKSGSAKVGGEVYYSLSKGLSLDDFKVGKSSFYDCADGFADFVALSKYVRSKVSEAVASVPSSPQADAAASSSASDSKEKVSEGIAHFYYIDEIRAFRARPDSERLAMITGDSLLDSTDCFFLDGYYRYGKDDGFLDVTNHGVCRGFPLLFLVSVTPYDPKVPDRVADAVYLPFKGGRFSGPVDAVSALLLIDEWCDGEIAIDDGIIASWKRKDAA